MSHSGDEGSAIRIDSAITERLAFIRYLFSVAEQQSRLPEIVRSIAVLTMHDVVDLFLQLVAQKVNARVPKGHHLDFGEYFSKIAAADPSLVLTRQQQMRELNAARASLKHAWVRPRADDVEALRVQVERFLAENTRVVYGMALESVSVVDLIRFRLARSHLRNAEAALSRGNTAIAIIEVAYGFDFLIDEYEQEAIAAGGWKSPFVFAEDFQFGTRFFSPLPEAFGGQAESPARREQREFESKVVTSIAWLSRGMKMLSLGFDYRRYARFHMLVPPVDILPAPGEDLEDFDLREEIGGEIDGWPPTEDDCRFCLDFVVECALQLQDVVFVARPTKIESETELSF